VFVTDTRDEAFFARKGVRLQAALRWYLEAPQATTDFGHLAAASRSTSPAPARTAPTSVARAARPLAAAGRRSTT